MLLSLPRFEESGQFCISLPNWYNWSFHFPTFLRLYMLIFLPGQLFIQLLIQLRRLCSGKRTKKLHQQNGLMDHVRVVVIAVLSLWYPCSLVLPWEPDLITSARLLRWLNALFSVFSHLHAHKEDVWTKKEEISSQQTVQKTPELKDKNQSFIELKQTEKNCFDETLQKYLNRFFSDFHLITTSPGQHSLFWWSSSCVVVWRITVNARWKVVEQHQSYKEKCREKTPSVHSVDWFSFPTKLTVPTTAHHGEVSIGQLSSFLNGCRVNANHDLVLGRAVTMGVMESCTCCRCHRRGSPAPTPSLDMTGSWTPAAFTLRLVRLFFAREDISHCSFSNNMA